MSSFPARAAILGESPDIQVGEVVPKEPAQQSPVTNYLRQRNVNIACFPGYDGVLKAIPFSWSFQQAFLRAQMLFHRFGYYGRVPVTLRSTLDLESMIFSHIPEFEAYSLCDDRRPPGWPAVRERWFSPRSHARLNGDGPHPPAMETSDFIDHEVDAAPPRRWEAPALLKCHPDASGPYRPPGAGSCVIRFFHG